jgi:hypothetical protein
MVGILLSTEVLLHELLFSQRHHRSIDSTINSLVRGSSKKSRIEVRCKVRLEVMKDGKKVRRKCSA